MEVKSVWLCDHCRSMFTNSEEFRKHLEGKKWNELNCPKCGKQLSRWSTVNSLYYDFFNVEWLRKMGMIKPSYNDKDEITLTDELVEWVEDNQGIEDEWEDD